jgi:flagellar basal-body rod protein FlgG
MNRANDEGDRIGWTARAEAGSPTEEPMLEGLHAAAAGMNAQQRRLDAVANDIANVSTTGYKRVRIGFRDLLYQSPGQGAGAGVTTGNGAAADVIGRSFAAGALRRTDRPLDLAISGPGFLQVRLPDGRLALTRDGNLHPGPDGRLRTAAGALLEPPVTLPPGAENDVAVAADGTVRVAGREAGRIALVTVAAPGALAPVAGNAFLPTPGSGAPAAAGAGSRVEQGALEGSNVDLADAMVDMIDAQRSFQLASRAIQMQDEMMGIANGVRR